MLPASAQEASEQKWHARSNSKKLITNHTPLTSISFIFISHIPGIIHSKTDSTYIAGWKRSGYSGIPPGIDGFSRKIIQHFPISNLWKSWPKRFVWDFQGSGFGCIAAKSSKCLLQKLRRPLVKTSHGCASMAQHSRRSFAFHRFLLFLGKRSKNYRTTDPKQCVARCRGESACYKAKHGPYAGQFVAHGGIWEINAQKPWT